MGKQSRPVSVLLVEDNPSDTALVQAQVAQATVDLALESAETLDSAIQQLRNRSYDVVLLDLSLPDSQGLSSLSLLTAVAQDTPVIVLTGQDDIEMAVQALSEGAQDYLLKTKIDSDTLIRSIRYTVERTRRQRAEAELRAAGVMQRQLFPASAPNIPNFDIAGRCAPVTYAGGDYFDFFSMGGNQLGVVIADVSGHGIGPAITMAQTRAVIRVFASMTHDVGEVLTRANVILTRDLPDETFVALFLARIDVHGKQFQFASAGHPGYLLSSNGRTKRRLHSQDPPLGIDNSTVFLTSPAIEFEDGDALFLFTDGLQEAINENREHFGKQRLFEAVRDHFENNAQSILNHLFGVVRAFRQEARREDDITAVLVKASSSSENLQDATGPARAAEEIVFDSDKQYEYFDVDDKGVVTVIRISDEQILSSEQCANLKFELVDYIRSQSPTAVIIDFQNVQRFSSEGINMCLYLKSELDDKNSELRLCGLNPQVREAFTVLNLDGNVFDVHDDIGEALSSF